MKKNRNKPLQRKTVPPSSIAAGIAAGTTAGIASSTTAGIAGAIGGGAIGAQGCPSL